MEKASSPVYEQNTLEFVTVALEFCAFVEATEQIVYADFTDKATKLLPLLYLKAALLPRVKTGRRRRTGTDGNGGYVRSGTHPHRFPAGGK